MALPGQFAARIQLCCALIISAPLVLLSAQASAQEAGPVSKWRENGLGFEIASLSLDQVRGFFIGRGFSSTNAAFLAETGCVFRSSIGNTGTKKSDPMIELDLSQWRIRAKMRQGPPHVREVWQAEWKARGVSEEAQIAFHYALFPTRQSFGPTDYNWGMLSFALPPGSRFDLEVSWRSGGKSYLKSMEGLKCGQ